VAGATALLYLAWLLSFPTWGDVNGPACHPLWPPISISDLFAHLLAVEARIKIQNQTQMSANGAARGGGNFRGRGGRDGGQGYHGGFGHRYGCGHGTGDRPTCQISEKVGHSVGRCWKRFNREFKLEEKSINNASSSYDVSYGVDTNWYTNAGELTISLQS
jgi:hypothetical protein